MNNGAYILNERTGTLHTYPASEACNIDAIPSKHRIIDSDTPVRLREHDKYRRDCKRCFRVQP